jgi:hypothetical protein
MIDNKPNDCFFCKKAYGSKHQYGSVWACSTCDKTREKLLNRARKTITEWREFCAKSHIRIDNNKLHFTQGDVVVSFYLDPANDQAPPKEVAMVVPMVLMPLPETTEGGETTAATT